MENAFCVMITQRDKITCVNRNLIKGIKCSMILVLVLTIIEEVILDIIRDLWRTRLLCRKTVENDNN